MTWWVLVIIDSCKSKEFINFSPKGDIFCGFQQFLVVPGVLAPRCLGSKYELQGLGCHRFVSIERS